MEFKKEDLLNYKNLKALITTDLPNARAKLLAPALRKYCFIRTEGDKNVYYRIQDNLVYKSYRKDIEGKVKLIQSQFIEESYSRLSKEDDAKIKEKYGSKLKIYKNATFAEYDSQLISLLTIDFTDVRMKSIDNTPYEVHFKNGYYDLKKNEFYDRFIMLPKLLIEIITHQLKSKEKP
jgi:hypothetical protein